MEAFFIAQRRLSYRSFAARLFWVTGRNARGEQITSTLPARGDLSETCQIRCDGPLSDMARLLPL
jgi:hypothetical protein